LALFPIDPVGVKAPSLSSDVKRSWIERQIKKEIGLLCLAQGSPVPLSQ